MKKKILCVEDSSTIRQQLNFALGNAGFQVIEANDGKEGLEALQNNPDIVMIIADINMPNMGGLDMIEKIHSMINFKSIPIVMLTSEGKSELIERAKAAGARGWLVKPFKFEQLMITVNKLTA